MSLETLIGEIVRAAVREELKPLRDELKAALARESLRHSTHDTDGLLSVEQVAAMMKVTEPTVRLWIKSGALKATRPSVGGKGGRIYRVLPADLEAFISAGLGAPAEEAVDIEAEATRIVALAARGRKT
jgi:excisionase family DNA binding protein